MGSADTVIGYVCVRAEEQGANGVGLELQRAAIEAGCACRGWQLLRIEQDVLSGTSLNRPGLSAAVDACRSGEAGGLVVSKLERLSRSTLDFARMLEDARARGFNVVALDLGLDLSTPQGELVANVIASAAQWERRLILEAFALERRGGPRAAVQVRAAGARAALSALASLLAAGRRARAAAVPLARRAWRDGARGLELARPPALAAARTGIELAARLARIALRVAGGVLVALARALVLLFLRLQVTAPAAARSLRDRLRRLASGSRKRLGLRVAALLHAELRSRLLARPRFRRLWLARQWLSAPRARGFAVLGTGGRAPLAVSEAVQGTSPAEMTAVERTVNELVVEAESVEVAGAPSPN